MNRLIKICLPILFVFWLIILNGCASTETKGGLVSEIQKKFKGTYTVDPNMESHMPKTVAILPFVDESRSRKGNEIVRRGFYNHFSSLPFKDMELYQVDHLLRKAGWYDPEVFPPARLVSFLPLSVLQ
jgi:hypothetical protein